MSDLKTEKQEQIRKRYGAGAPVKEIGERIKRLLSDNGETQNDLAGLFGCTGQTVNNKLNGKSSFDVYELMMISEYYNVSVDYLLFGKDHTAPDPGRDDPGMAAGLNDSGRNDPAGEPLSPAAICSTLATWHYFGLVETVPLIINETYMIGGDPQRYDLDYHRTAFYFPENYQFSILSNDLIEYQRILDYQSECGNRSEAGTLINSFAQVYEGFTKMLRSGVLSLSEYKEMVNNKLASLRREEKGIQFEWLPALRPPLEPHPDSYPDTPEVNPDSYPAAHDD